MLISILPLSILKSCRCYRFDVNIFEVDITVVDINCFSQILILIAKNGNLHVNEEKR